MTKAPGLQEAEAYVASRFDHLVDRFKPTVPARDERLNALCRALAPLRGKVILDLGCGQGRFARHFERLGAAVIGLDASRAMLERGDGLSRVLGSACRLPFADSRFDAAIAVELLEHLPRPLLAIEELHRVLRPGGILALLDKNAGCLDARRPWLPGLAVKWLDERRGRWMYPPGAPVRERWFWPRRLARQLQRGFELVEVHHLLMPEEASSFLFVRWPQTRRFVLWTARKPGGCDV